MEFLSKKKDAKGFSIFFHKKTQEELTVFSCAHVSADQENQSMFSHCEEKLLAHFFAILKMATAEPSMSIWLGVFSPKTQGQND